MSKMISLSKSITRENLFCHWFSGWFLIEFIWFSCLVYLFLEFFLLLWNLRGCINSQFYLFFFNFYVPFVDFISLNGCVASLYVEVFHQNHTLFYFLVCFNNMVMFNIIKRQSWWVCLLVNLLYSRLWVTNHKFNILIEWVLDFMRLGKCEMDFI